MNVLICGADGFLGRHIATALAAHGHKVTRGVRRAREPGDVVVDYRADTTPAVWLPRLAGADIVINAVGILREAQAGDFEAIHQRTPAALFEACRVAGIRRVIQVSALGAADTAYLASKHAADAVLLRLLPEATVLRPGLVFGADGASSRFFLAVASLPVCVVAGGAGEVQPVHVDDVAEAVVRVAEGAHGAGGVLELAGPRRLGYRDWMGVYRRLLALPPAPALSIPAPVMAAAACLAGVFRASLLSAEAWSMLRAGNTGDPRAAQAVLGRALTPPEHFASAEMAQALRLRAFADWRRPLLRSVLALIWLITAMLSAGIHPLADSLALLAPFGLAGACAVATLAGATLLDLAMGVLTLARPGRRLWLAQLVLVAGYSALIAWRLPEFLTHPFGPVLKNLAVAALLILLWAEEEAP